MNLFDAHYIQHERFVGAAIIMDIQPKQVDVRFRLYRRYGI